MNDIYRSISMLVVLCYFFYLWSLFSLACKTRLATSFRWNYFLSINITTVLILVALGSARFIYGKQPSWIVFTAALLFCIWLMLGKVKIIGHCFLDSALASCSVTGVASVVPAGIIELQQGGLTFALMWQWAVISFLVAIILAGEAYNMWEERKLKRKRKTDRKIGDVSVENKNKEVT